VRPEAHETVVEEIDRVIERRSPEGEQGHVESARRYREAKRRKSPAKRYAIAFHAGGLYAQRSREHHDRVHANLDREPVGWTPNA